MTRPLFLSRLFLNYRSREVRKDLADCVAMHRTIMSLFPDGLSSDGTARSAAAALFRVEPMPDGRTMILIQSTLAPDWSELPSGYLTPGEAPQCKPIGESIAKLAAGMPLRFRLLANPTKKIGTASGPEGEKHNGKRVELRGEDACLNWLARKGEQHGFRLRSVRAAPGVASANANTAGRISGFKGKARDEHFRLTFAGVLFEGVLEISDPEQFRATLISGIGPGKAYGHGLLSLARAE